MPMFDRVSNQDLDVDPSIGRSRSMQQLLDEKAAGFEHEDSASLHFVASPARRVFFFFFSCAVPGVQGSGPEPQCAPASIGLP